MGKFARDIEEWVEKTGISADVVLQKLSLDALAGVQLRSPVDQGRFRGSHRLSINSVDGSVAPAPPKDAVGERSIGKPLTGAEVGEGISKSGRIRFGDTIHITNSLPYAQFLENGGSALNNHAPDGIYGATFHELMSKVDAAIRSARKS